MEVSSPVAVGASLVGTRHVALDQRPLLLLELALVLVAPRMRLPGTFSAVYGPERAVRGRLCRAVGIN